MSLLFLNAFISFQGDFIFYSVLVAKSAQYSFPCFVSSFLVILAGLGGTLVLLAVYKHALPALPISIFLAVGFYVLVRFMAEPWIHAVMSTPFYVCTLNDLSFVLVKNRMGIRNHTMQ